MESHICIHEDWLGEFSHECVCDINKGHTILEYREMVSSLTR